MPFLRIAFVSAAIAIAIMGAQAYALTKFFKPSDSIELRWPQTSVRETLEYMNPVRWELDVRLPFGETDNELDLGARRGVID